MYSYKIWSINLRVNRYRSGTEDSDSDVEEQISADSDVSDDDDSGSNQIVDKAIINLQKTWASLSPPAKECDLIGQWYAAIWSTKKTQTLFVGQLLKRFLVDKSGPVDIIEMKCLKPKMGPGQFLEEPNQPDISNFQLADIIQGPLQVCVKKDSTKIVSRSRDDIKKKNIEVLQYQDVQNHFFAVKGLNRKSIADF